MLKNKKILFIASVIIILGLVIALVVGIYLKNKGEDAETVFNKYISYINDKKYEEMYNLITEDIKKEISKEDFIKRNSNIYEGIDMSDMKVNITNINKSDKSKINISYNMAMNTIAGNISFDNNVLLIRNNDNNYKIQWSSNIILPDLENDDKVVVKTLKAERGNILDRNDKILAGKGTVSSIGLVPGKMGDNKEQNIAKISELLGVSVESITKSLGASYVKDDTFVPIKKVSKDKQELKDTLLQIPGVKISNAESRVYSLGEEASHLIGYVQTINAEELEKNKDKGYSSNSIIGKSGLEKIYEDKLRGRDGCEISIVDKNGEKKKSIAKEEIRNGEDVKITIDSDLQKKIYNQVKDVKSAFVVMNPKTGEILALVSTPTYNSNDFVLGMTENQWNNIKNDERNILLNRYQATWSPGSTFKPVTGAIGITTGKINPDEDYGKSGLSWQKDSSWGDYKITTLTPYEETANLKNALIRSDNIYFAKAALKIGSETFAEQLNKIGFNEEVPFEQSLSKSQYSSGNKFDSEIQLADSGYGQGKILVNPIHMASIYSSFVNNGNMVKPYLEYKESKEPKYWKQNVFTEEAANTIKEDLIQVVESPNGTAHDAKVNGVTIGGKTGTAELKKSKDEAGEIIGWFNAFTADNSNKQFVVISMVEDARQVGGSHYLFPKVKSIFE